MKEIIRYYFLEGRASRIVAGQEQPLSQHEFHDFILNKKAKMTAIVDEVSNRKFQDFEG